MNKLSYQPLPVLSRAETSDAPWTSNSAKILWAISTLSTFFALFGAVMICLIGFKAFTPRTLESKAPSGVPVLPATNSTLAAAARPDNGLGLMPPEANQALPGTIVGDHSIIDQTPAPVRSAAPTPGPTPSAEKSVSDKRLLNGVRPDAARTNLDKQIPEPARKSLEKKRRKAERKRSRLEAMYRKNAISSEAYKKGEEKYRSGIERYRREMHARSGSQNDEGRTN